MFQLELVCACRTSCYYCAVGKACTFCILRRGCKKSTLSLSWRRL